MTAIDDRLAALEAANADLRRQLAHCRAEFAEARAQETATAEVLRVINSSPGDLAPVFDAMLEKAMALCEAAFGGLWTFDGDRYVATALRGVPDEYARFLAQTTLLPGLGSAPYRFLHGERAVIQHLDLAGEEPYRAGDPQRLALVDLGGARTALQVPLVKDDVVLGVITIYRRQVRPFTDKQIALLQNFAAQAVIAMENARLLTETREALEQQTATAEVLQVINSSPGDLAPVFDAMLERAMRLCEAAHGQLMVYDGERERPVAVHGGPEFARWLRERGVVRPPPGSLGERLLKGERVAHIIDAAEDEAYRSSPTRRAVVEIGGCRTILGVGLSKDDTVVGAIVVYREELRPFSDKQIALLQNFAAQAVIAMENARLLTETREALERQTATAEVLQVINSSLGDLAPVFEAIVEKAMRLCDAAFGYMVGREDGESGHTLAVRGIPADYAAFRRRNPVRAGQAGTAARIRAGEPFVHTLDLKDDDLYRRGDPQRRAMVDLGGARTSLIVALKRGPDPVGTINLYRQEVRPFTDKQIALLQNFAAQAVIAMENARLITETREALERQTATAEVLQVINSSPGDLAPVFDAMLEKAMRLCEAAFGALRTYDGNSFRAVAARGVPEPFAEFYAYNPPSYGPGTGPARLLSGEPFVHVADLATEEPYLTGEPNRRALVDLGGARTSLAVPLRKDDMLVGFIMIYRQEVRPFSDKQIALLQNFAAQAVIAMENARLITETREALEQQTATAEVLQVINSSPGDLAPVFEAMLHKAHTLCEASFGALMTYDGERFHAVAHQGTPPPFREFLAAGIRPGSGDPFARMVEGAALSHIHDLSEVAAQHPDQALPRSAVELGGIRSLLVVPLRKDHALLGAITAYRQEVRPFTDKQIALLQNFAAQAVIAIENARLLTETREALEQQTATAEVLQVINSSPGNLAPVFDAMLEKAMRLCGASFGFLTKIEGKNFRAVALRGAPPAFVEFFRQPQHIVPGQAHHQLMQGTNLVHVEDFTAESVYHPGDPALRALADLAGARTGLCVALRNESALLGAIVMYRKEVRRFSDKQIALLQNFAAQAVIAIENARLLTETREALEQQTATAEVLQVINASPGDLAPVFEAMLEKALRLCGASLGTLWAYDGEWMRPVAMRGVSREYAQYVSHEPLRPGAGALGSFVRGETILHVVDLKETEAYRNGDTHRQALVDLGGGRSLLGVPLRTDDRLRGAFLIYKREPQPFSDKQIALLQNFAAQAVIAMENARLLTETREALEFQTATSDVLKVISGAAFELQPVLETVVATAVRLCRADQAVIYRLHDGEYRWVAGYSLLPEYEAIERDVRIMPSEGTLVGRVALRRDTVHIVDAWTDALYDAKDDARTGDIHTMLGVPLMREGLPIGVIGLARQRIEAYSEKEIALVRTFADQAVIAIENARLIAELRRRTDDLQESLEYQTATSDVLKVISRSTFDLQPVLDALVETASRLCDAQMGHLAIREGEAYRFVATHSVSPEWDALTRDRSFTPGRGTVTSRTLLERRIVHMADCAADPEYAWPEAVTVGKIRTSIGVPLLREGEAIGVMILARQRVEAFTERQIELIGTFADQAVIAIENARLITETREALEQQTATAEILQVINSSPGELGPVFQALLDRALALCGAAFGVLWTYDGDHLNATALHGVPAAFAEFLTRAPHPVGSQNAHGRLFGGEPVVHVLDLQADEAHRDGDPIRRALVELGGGRVLLAVPLRKDDAFLGIFTIYRQEPHPFSNKQIALLQSFAAQAVIAMDNARLLGEIRQRQAELRVTFDNMGDGVAMFAADLKLAAWNTNFQQILDLPEEFLAARPGYAEFFGYLAKRGEYAATGLEAELSSRLDETERELRFERTRPDGRVVEVRRNPVPGGGFVLIYSDITERKRAEAEIAAARDAAERALGELKTAQASLIHAEKMASLGQLTAGIAHEIKNPLNFVNNFSGVSIELLDELKDAAAPALAALGGETRGEVEEIVATLTGNLEKIAEHGRRADGIVTSMLDHSRGGSGERRRVDINALVDEALNLAFHGARAQDRDFTISLDRDFDRDAAAIELVPQDMTRVLLNLFANGFYAADRRRRDSAGAEFRSALTVTTRDLGEAVEIRVRDNGAGIAPEHRDKLFQPFFTTKPTGEGTGLGLSICWDVVTQQHGGTIAVDSAPGEFTEFTVRLPRAPHPVGRAA